MICIVTILKPKSAYLNPERDEMILTWSSNMTNQVAYEVIYKRKEAQSWQTTGKIESTDTTFDLTKIFEAINKIYQVEIYYRVLLYYSGNEGEESFTGMDGSEAYSIMFKPTFTKTFNMYDGDDKEVYPLFENFDAPNTRIVKMKTNDGIKKFKAILVEEGHPAAGSIGVKTREGTKFFSTASANFEPSNIYGGGEMHVYREKYTPVYAYNHEPKYDTGYTTLYNYRVEAGYYSYLYSVSSYWYTQYNWYQYGYGGFSTGYKKLSGYLTYGTTQYSIVDYVHYPDGNSSARNSPCVHYKTGYTTYVSGYRENGQVYSYSYGGVSYGYSGTPIYYQWYGYGRATTGYNKVSYISGYNTYQYISGYYTYNYLSGYRNDSYSYTTKI